MNKYIKNEQKKLFSSTFLGKIFGFIAGISWALVSIFLFLHDQSFKARQGDVNGILNSLQIGVSISFIQEFFALIWAFLVLLMFKRIKDLKKAFQNKNILWIILGSIFGGPFGSVTYILGIQYIGSGLSGSITVTYPVLAAMLAYLFLKQKMNINSIVGGSISLLAILTLGILQFSSGDIKNGWGFLFALFAAIGWAIESFLSSKAMDSGIDPYVSIFVRQCSSVLVLALILVPSFNSFGSIKDVVSNIDVFWILGSSIIGIVSFVLFYIAINKAGVGVASGLNICYVVWIIIFELALFRFYPWYIYILVATVFCAQMFTLVPDFNKRKLKK